MRKAAEIVWKFKSHCEPLGMSHMLAEIGAPRETAWLFSANGGGFAPKYIPEAGYEDDTRGGLFFGEIDQQTLFRFRNKWYGLFQAEENSTPVCYDSVNRGIAKPLVQMGYLGQLYTCRELVLRMSTFHKGAIGDGYFGDEPSFPYGSEDEGTTVKANRATFFEALKNIRGLRNLVIYEPQSELVSEMANDSVTNLLFEAGNALNAKMGHPLEPLFWNVTPPAPSLAGFPSLKHVEFRGLNVTDFASLAEIPNKFTLVLDGTTGEVSNLFLPCLSCLFVD